MDEFYIVLPSNTPGSANTTSNFTVRLPHTLELDSNWTVALASIIYPYSFPSVGIDEDDIIGIKLVNPNYRFLDDRKFVHIELKVPSMQFSSVEHLRLTLNSLIREAYQQQQFSSGYDGASRTKRQVTDLFFHENPVDYWEKIDELRTKQEQFEKEVKQEENELSADTTDVERKKVLQSELPLKRIRMQRKKDELEELERAAERRDQESPENEQRKISDFFQHHPEDYNKKLNESRLIFTQHLSGLQEVMSKHIGEKDINKIRQLNTEVDKIRTKIKHMQRNLTIFENAALQRDHQKSLSEYEELSHQQNSAFVDEFFQKHPTNYWQIIHNNYKGLTEHFQKIEQLRAKAVGLKNKASFQKQIERAKQLIEYRRKRFAALEFEAKKRDEQQQFVAAAAANTITAPTASALIGREALKKRTGISANTGGEMDDTAVVGPQTTTAATTTHGEALREKILEQQKRTDDDDDDTADVSPQTTTAATTTHGEALREKILEQQKRTDDDDDTADVSPQITTTAIKTHGEALKEKILQEQKDIVDDKPNSKHDGGGGGSGTDEKMTRGQSLIAGIKQSEEQKREWIPPKDNDDGRAPKHGEMLWKLLRSTAPPNQQQMGDVIHHQFAGAEHTRGQVLMELMKNILEEKTDAADAQQHSDHLQKPAHLSSTLRRGEALKELIKKTQNEQLPQSSAKTTRRNSKVDVGTYEVFQGGRESTAAEFVFNDLAQRFILITGAGVLHVDVSKHLAYVLGFDNSRLFHGEQARYMPDLSGGVKQLYVYAPKLIEECIIGDRMAPLLRVVNVSAAPVSGTEIILKNSSNKMTHVTFNPDSINWGPLLALEQVGGGEMQYFVGTRHQRGAGLLRNVARFLMPVASNMLKAVSREGVTAGSRIMEDLSQGKALKESIQAHAKHGMENLAEKLKQCGKGAPTRKRKRPVKKVKVPLPMHSLRGNKRQAIDQLTFAP
ncbi:hypothetical protein niasHT_028727 [Heterodera trifolii]|uniref:Uncharacterized protein n=1 Tax=Heterodera trifolii TaxID=157864 RepID=A0ABD2JCV3_9BILA